MTLNQNMLIILRFRIRWFTRNLCWPELRPKPIDTAFGSFGKGPHSVGFECNLARAERGRRNRVVASAKKDLRKAEMPIKVSNLLDLPLMRTMQRNSGKHCKHKAKIHTDCTVLHINYLPSSCGEPASTTCQTMWKGLSSCHELQCLLVSSIHHSNWSSQLYHAITQWHQTNKMASSVDWNRCRKWLVWKCESICSIWR